MNTVRTGTTPPREEGDAASVVKEFSCMVVRSLATVTGINIHVATAVDEESLDVRLALGEECSSSDVIAAGHNRCVGRVVRRSTWGSDREVCSPGNLLTLESY
jgi:hypothetical protein